MAQRRWLTIVVFFLLSLIAAGALTYSQQPKYQSTARVFISTEVTGNSTDAYAASLFSVQRVQSYAELATSRELMQRVISRLNLDMTPDNLASKISSAVAQNTVIIDITVTDPSAANAQRIAKTESEVFTDYLTELETPVDKSASPVKASVASPASYNGTQISPKPVAWS